MTRSYFDWLSMREPIFVTCLVAATATLLLNRPGNAPPRVASLTVKTKRIDHVDEPTVKTSKPR